MRDMKCSGSRGLRLRAWRRVVAVLAMVLSSGMLGGGFAVAQENPLDRVTTQTAPPAPKTEEEKKPVIEGAENAVKLGTSHRDARIRVDVNLVLVPMTVTDPMNRLVTGLERDNFQVFDNNVGQTIRSFSTDDAPVTIGIVFDLSGSMTTKFARSRKALSEFLRTCNPQDEFFVVGFNDRPAVIVELYVGCLDRCRGADGDAETGEPYGADRCGVPGGKQAGKRASMTARTLLIISDGGDNRSRCTPEGELRRVVPVRAMCRSIRLVYSIRMLRRQRSNWGRYF